MKKLILFAIAVLTISLATAQTQTDKATAAAFVTSRANAYVRDLAPVFVKDLTELDQLESRLDSGKYNYQKYSFVFFGEISAANLVGGVLNSYTQDRKKPVLYYTLVKEGGQTIIWVLSGHNSI
jgi:hypothetical protein